MLKLLIVSIIFLLSNAVAKPVNYGEMQISDITKIYDGDTITVNLNCNVAILCNKISIRLYGYDTPEIRTKCKSEKALAKKAKQYLINAIDNAKDIKLVDTLRGKYFRIVGTLILDGKNVGDALIQQGLAYPYFGGTKKPWCTKTNK